MEKFKSVSKRRYIYIYISGSTYDAQDVGIFVSPPHIQQLASRSSPGSDDNQIELRKEHIQLEICCYLCFKSIVVSSKEDPLQWWNKKRSLFSNFARTARKWLSVCSSLTDLERVFSFCGVALSAESSKMRGSTL